MQIVNRKEWIDVLRAFAIIFVIYGHSFPGIKEFFIITSPVKMPLFFILSGYLFNVQNGITKKYMRGIFNKLVIPWFSLALIAFIPTFGGLILKNELHFFIIKICDVIIGKEHWYMPCFIIGSCLHFFIRKFVKSDTVHIIISLSLFFVGIYFKEKQIFDVFMINRAFHVQLYFSLGYLVKKYWYYLELKKKYIVYYCSGIYILGILFSLSFFPNQTLDVHKCFYYNILLCLLLIISGNTLLIGLCSNFEKYPEWLTFIGRNSLVIYMLQIYGFICFSSISSIFHLESESLSGPFWALLRTIVVIIVCSVLSIFINKYMPFVTGGRK